MHCISVDILISIWYPVYKFCQYIAYYMIRIMQYGMSLHKNIIKQLKNQNIWRFKKDTVTLKKKFENQYKLCKIYVPIINVPDKIKERVKDAGKWDGNPLNLFRITWKNEPKKFGGLYHSPDFIELPENLLVQVCAQPV